MKRMEREPITITSCPGKKQCWLEFRGDRYRVISLTEYGYVDVERVNMVEVALGTSQNWAKDIIDRTLIDHFAHNQLTDDKYRRLVGMLEKLKVKVAGASRSA
jgi:hypothetical protein